MTAAAATEKEFELCLVWKVNGVVKEEKILDMFSVIDTAPQISIEWILKYGAFDLLKEVKEEV